MTNDNNETYHNDFFDRVVENGVSTSLDGTQLTIDAVQEQEAAAPELSDVQAAGHDEPAPFQASREHAAEVTLAENTDMPHEARRVVVHLMRQGVIIAAQKPTLFELVVRYESYIRRHLSEVYLQLVLDAKSGVVFVASPAGEFGKAEVESDSVDNEEEFASLISKRTLSLYDTLLLLVLRKHYQDRETAGEQKITIDLERLESYLTPFLPLTDHASLDRKKLLARVKEMAKRKVLSTIRGSEERYEITPVIRYVVNAEFLQSMLAEYQRLANETGVGNRQDNDTTTNAFSVNIDGLER